VAGGGVWEGAAGDCRVGGEGALGFGEKRERPFICGRAYWATWATGHRASIWAASGRPISCWAGPTLWAEVAAQHSP
jgi:hypothetical protein